MAKKIDEIHDELRETTPLIHRIQIHQQVESGVRPGMPGEMVTSNVWMLMSSDRSLGIHLAPDQLLVFSNTYSRYAEFEKILDKCLDVLFKHMRSIMDVTSLGVRYVDLIKPLKGEVRGDYVMDRLLPADFDGLEAVGGMSIGTYKVDEAELRVRCITQPDALAIPEDMISLLAMSQDPGIQLKLETLGNGILLDIDAVKSYSKPERMIKQGVLDQLGSLHQTSNAFFRHKSVCKERAFEVWKGGI